MGRISTVLLSITLAAVTLAACDAKDSPTAPTAPAITTPPQNSVSQAAAPELTSITPTSVSAGGSVIATLNGTGFAGGATLEIAGAGVSATDITVVTNTSITARLTIDAAAELGPRAIKVTTSVGTSSAQMLTIGAPTPVVNTMTPSSLVAGSTTTVTITGTAFVPGSTTMAVSGGGVTVTNISGPLAAATGHSISASFSVDANASPGSRTVTITTPGGTSSFTFAVAARLPVIESFSANPVIITRGRSSTLSWRGITNATSCNINVGVGPVPCADGRIDVTPTVTTEYMLSAIGPGGREWMYTTVVVEDPPTPVVVVIPPTPPQPGIASFSTPGTSTFTVPPGVTQITIDAQGGQGGTGWQGPAGGLGGRTIASLTVTPGETLTVRVGGSGGDGGVGSGGTGGINGGGAGGTIANGGGGGASELRRGGTILLVAGGGGGSSQAYGYPGAAGGAGGGAQGGDGGAGIGVLAPPAAPAGGHGGTQTSGGAGGLGGGSGSSPAGQDGAFGVGGAGTIGSAPSGGGGGGYYGGGGGGSGFSGPSTDSSGGGGGGGSSFVIPGATNVTLQQGVRAGNGAVVITWQ